VGGSQFEPYHLHHPVHRYRTPPDTRAFVPRNVGFSSLRSSLYRSPQDENAVFAPPSLHRKIPFLTRLSETGSMTAWGVGSSVPRKPWSVEKGPFLRGSCCLFLTIPVSADNNGLSGGFLASGLCVQNFRSRRLNFGTELPAGARRSSPEMRGSNSFRTYCGFNPSASNCWLHSAGASRSRSTPMPRGKRPSTAALTRSGARNASEMVILT
jgi:hypothetical protein